MDTYVKGTCHLMCPEKERVMRERENLLHILELDVKSVSLDQKGPRKKNVHPRGDPKRIVKEFQRSAAGRNMQQPSELRPFSVLMRTVEYLLGTIVEDTRVPWNVIYEFITDRLRSVRQDMIIQQLPCDECIAILEPIVRFHAYAAYRLCEVPIDIFDPVLNETHLKECLKRLLVMYDAEETRSSSRNEMEALYTVVHLGDTTALTRALSVNIERRCRVIETALRLSLSRYGGNYVRVCKLLQNLPPLLAAAASLHFPLIRRQALQAMNSAYSSKNLQYPVSRLKSLLLFNNEIEAIAQCRYYGLRVAGNMIHFSKGTFNTGVKIFPAARLKFINAKLDSINLPTLLLGNKDSAES